MGINSDELMWRISNVETVADSRIRASDMKIDEIETSIRNDIRCIRSYEIKEQVIDVLRDLGILNENYDYEPHAGISISEERFMKFVEDGIGYT